MPKTNDETLFSSDGFTLVEVSIVIIVIGLLIGSILVGRDLIDAAEVRKLAAQPERFDVAIFTFRSKYSCLPGDCANAGTLAFKNHAPPYNTITNGGIEDGDGNGIIRNNILFDDLSPLYTGPGHFEIQNAYWWLQQSGLISNVGKSINLNAGSYTHIPAEISGGQQGFSPTWNVLYIDKQPLVGGYNFFSKSGHYYMLTANVYEGFSSYTAILPAKAYRLDAKLDDGLPRSGRVLGGGNDE
jgi:prepilin-type N-terminal cleavage/methylation domain-containing protein